MCSGSSFALVDGWVCSNPEMVEDEGCSSLDQKTSLGLSPGRRPVKTMGRVRAGDK